VETLDALMTRRSVRAFTDEPVTPEQLDVLLRAAMAAPSASNGRSWRFVVVRDRERLERISNATLFSKPMAGAAVGLVICADRPTLKYPGFWVIDCSAAIENLLLAAHATGLGGVWIGVHPIAPFRAAVRRVIEAPRTVIVHSMVAIGHPAQTPAPVDRYDAAFVHQERW
jgi:nitroreductase